MTYCQNHIPDFLYLLRSSTGGTVTGYLVPWDYSSWGEDCSATWSDELISSADALYLMGGYQIARFSIKAKQFSTYNIVPRPGGSGGGLMAGGIGDGQNVYAFQVDASKGHEFLVKHVIMSKPASLHIKKGGSATLSVSEGLYNGQFTSEPGNSQCAGVSPAQSSGAFTVTYEKTSKPCFLQFSDSSGNSVVYVEIK